MSDQFTDSLLDFSRVQSHVSGETRSLVSQMLDFEQSEPSPAPVAAIHPGQPQQGLTCSPTPTYSPPSILPSLVPLVGRILEDLEKDPSRLLSLNPSRRDAITQHLNKLSGLNPTTALHLVPNTYGSRGSLLSRGASPHSPPMSASLSPSLSYDDQSASLRRWIEGNRTTAQNSALRCYFEEIALLTLGQAMVLKSWSDRTIRKWSISDLGRLNWALSTALRPLVPLDREGWQMTRPNLYSWYNPNEVLQKEIWNALDSWKLTDENPAYLANLLKSLRKAHSEVPEPHGFDSRFYEAIWSEIENFGFDPSPERGVIKRNKTIFCPTLRDGELVRTGPDVLQWVGLETSPFQFMTCELLQVWACPIAPPIWSIGTGLEVHTRDQLTFAMSSPKPNILCRIADMEACDSAFVLEEQVVRLNGRNPNSLRFKEQIDGLAYFKRLKSAGTSLGDLQACVALNKLRPGGLLWWTREEGLSTKDGKELLNFLLERARLVAEWDFSELEHTLPASTPLFPKHLYLFQRDHHLENRSSHRPVRHCVHGQLRSHVELPLVLEDAFKMAVSHRPASEEEFQSASPMTFSNTLERGHWKIITQVSPSPQREWIDKWPDPTAQSVVRYLDQLRASSLPLANFTTIRPTPEGEGSHQGAWSLQSPQRGVWVAAESDAEGRRLVTRPLPQPGEKTQGSGFMIIVSDEASIAPLSAYLTTQLVHRWLEQHAERRGDRWILTEQVVKWIPAPRELLRASGIPCGPPRKDMPPLESKWERMAANASQQPKVILEELAKHSTKNVTGHCQIFVQVARALEYLKQGQSRFLSLVRNDGSIKWGPLLDILPEGECVTLSMHPRVRLTGSLPSHLPIHKMDRVKTPLSGILFSTESGFTIHVGSDANLLVNIVWDQLEGLQHPTWSELLHSIQLPRRLELAESTAMDVLNSHAEQVMKVRELQELLNSLELFE